MSETQKTQIAESIAETTENKGESTTDNNEGKPISIIERADKAAQRIELANAELRKLLDEQEIVMAQQKLGGKTDAGQIPPTPTEETAREYSRKLLNGELVF